VGPAVLRSWRDDPVQHFGVQGALQLRVLGAEIGKVLREDGVLQEGGMGGRRERSRLLPDEFAWFK